MKVSVPQNQKWSNLGRLRTKKLLAIAFSALLVLVFSVSAYAQNTIRVRGRVTNESGQPVPKVSVVVKGTTNGVTGNDNGDFEISAPDNGALIISSVGYSPQEVAIRNQSSIAVSLNSLTTSMNAVVVVGYGIQRKRNVTGSVASVNLETMENAPNTNIGQYLQGTVPGLNVGLSTFAGGTPPINIRGRVTLNGSQATVIIVDGIQYTGSLSSINPDDIATIDILKDASATAVYGAQGANGVILITSKKGRYNQKPKVAFSTSYTIQNPTGGDKLRPKNREEYLQGIRDAFWMDAYLAPGYTQPNPNFDLLSKVDASMKAGYSNGTEYNWWDEATNTGSILENTLSVSGGGDRVTYLLSGGAVDQKGYIINDKFKRKSIRANLEIKPLNWWKIGLVSSGSFVNQDGAEPGIGLINIFSPLLVPYDSLGNVIPSPTNTVLGSPMTSYYVTDRDRHQYYFANVYSDLDVPFIKGLNYRLNFGNNLRNDQHYYASRFDANQNGRAYKDNRSYYDYTFDNILTYKRTFGKHDITATALYGAIERKFERTYAEGTGFSRITLGYNNIGGADIKDINPSSLRTATDPNPFAWEEALNYQMGRVNYVYDGKYIITGTVRRDGFSGFAENFKYGVFPSVSLGWVISSEDFMKNLSVVNFLKLRAGYGTIGNQVPRYFSIPIVNTNTSYVYGDNSTTVFGQQVDALGNDNLKWERTTGLNIGADFTLLNERLTGNLEYYNNNTTDLIFSVAVPNITGFSLFRTNLGKINNTGWEVGLTYKIINNKDLNWTSTFNIWGNNNKIKHLTGVDANGDGKEDDIVSSGLFIGKSIRTIYDYEAGPIYQLNDTRLPGFQIGSLSVTDLDKSGTITAADRKFLGRREPAYRMSLYNSVGYKGFALSFFLNSVQGGKDGYRENNVRLYFREDNSIRNNDLRGVVYWTPANPNAKYPRIISGTHSTIEPPLYESRSFVRLQDVSLAYNFSPKILNKIKAQAISIYVSGKNLVTWTNWEGWDPEVDSNNGANENQGRIVTDGRPVLRGFTFGVHITY
ncbi:MAG TPA: SusC/RagA family TonB-linked outer membrane protein [Chitinophagaceae bacterium]|nr:SusC/RagA family TonB-linked outer membrane protein [Chitinophagaceae bacterium]